MDLFETIQARRSVRAYVDKPVEEDKLKRILEAARMAPSASNRQAWKFVVVRDPSIRTAVANAADQAFIAKAAVVIAAVSLEPQRMMGCEVSAGTVDCAIALEHIALAAAALGLGTCWIGKFNQDGCKKILNVPREAKIIEMMTLGYPADAAGQRKRKTLDEIVSYDRFE